MYTLLPHSTWNFDVSFSSNVCLLGALSLDDTFSNKGSPKSISRWLHQDLCILTRHHRPS
jgi:hypothetical protein